MERAKGIYSFSHLTFQEYFAAREIVVNSAWESLVEHITDKRWREVFLLTAGMMRKADDLVLLMKRKVDVLVASDEKLQEFLTWVEDKSSSLETSYKHTVVRAFYCSLYLVRSLHLDLADFIGLTNIHTLDLERTSNLDKVLYPAQTLAYKFDLKQEEILEQFNSFKSYLDNALYVDLNIDLMRDFSLAHEYTYKLIPDQSIDKLTRDPYLKLQQLKLQLPTDESIPKLKEWWEVNGQAWIGQLKLISTELKNIRYNWYFTDAQMQLFQQYYNANKLLVDCLNSDCYVSREVRQEIEDTLLLPMAEIEKRQG